MAHLPLNVHNDSRRLLPPSFRPRFEWRLAICAAAGAAVGIVGTAAHRMGASANIPYGLALALVIVGISAWSARARCGALGLGFHLVTSSAAAWLLAMPGPGGDVIVPVASSAFTTFFSRQAGYLWLFGMIAVQAVLLLIPRAWCIVPSRTPLDVAGDGHGRQDVR